MAQFNSMNYYKKRIYLALVDKEDNIEGKMERWRVHKKGVLHRAFTVAIFYRNKLVLQHRKHPVFDGVYDVTCSSHPVFKNGRVEENKKAVYKTLRREWDIKKEDLLGEPKKKGKILYKANDKKSPYRENELCHFYAAEVKKLPKFKPEFAYGMDFLERKNLGKTKLHLAPWAKKLVPLL